MALPPDVEAAKERMDSAEAAARADVESVQSKQQQYDPKRRKQLLAELDKAMNEYLHKMAELLPK